MIGILLLGLLLIGAAIALAVRAVAMPRLSAAERLGQIDAYGFEVAKDQAGTQRAPRFAIKILAERIGRAAATRFNRFDEGALRRQLMSAGLYTTTPTTFLGYRIMATVFLPLFFLLFAAAGGSSGAFVVILALLSAPIAWVVPQVAVRKRSERRLAKIEAELPELIDLLVVTVEAGLGFAGSIQACSGRLGGALGDEFRLMLQEQRMGLSTEEALSNLAARCDTPSMRSFVRSVLQGERLGVSIGSIMRNLAIEMRKTRRQTAEERAQKAPIKILFPLVFLIFPPIFIVLLYPAIHSFGQAFGG
jgi:tight adherence protein C